MHLFDTGAAHSKPPHNITIVKVSDESLILSISLFYRFCLVDNCFYVIKLVVKKSINNCDDSLDFRKTKYFPIFSHDCGL